MAMKNGADYIYIVTFFGENVRVDWYLAALFWREEENLKFLSILQKNNKRDRKRDSPYSSI